MPAGAEFLGSPYIAFDGVEKSFASTQGETVAVRGVDFSVQRGELVTVLGPSGCGKSTTLNMIAGL